MPHLLTTPSTLCTRFGNCWAPCCCVTKCKGCCSTWRAEHFVCRWIGSWIGLADFLSYWCNSVPYVSLVGVVGVCWLGQAALCWTYRSQIFNFLGIFRIIIHEFNDVFSSRGYTLTDFLFVSNLDYHEYWPFIANIFFWHNKKNKALYISHYQELQATKHTLKGFPTKLCQYMILNYTIVKNSIKFLLIW